MYNPPNFREDRIEVLHDLIRAHPFATLVALGQDGLFGNHLPFVLHGDLGEHGTLRGHVSRANPLWKSVDPTIDVLAIFQGVESYITPSWYPSKKQHGKVVPTWNYAVVHAYGSLEIVDDVERLRAHLHQLTFKQENERAAPWAVGDAPDDYIERQLKGIVGIELPISRIEGKWKMSQNRKDQDRKGVSRGLRAESDGHPAGMADLVERYGENG